MIKWIFCAVLAISSALAGFCKASCYTERVRLLSRLTTALKYLEAEMSYRQEPLPVLLARIGQNSGGVTGSFFFRTAELLTARRASTLQEAWRQSIEEVLPADILTEEDITILEELGYELGGTDMASQKAMFAHCFCGLAAQLETAKAAQHVLSRMYRGLGISAGVLAAVLLL